MRKKRKRQEMMNRADDPKPAKPERTQIMTTKEIARYLGVHEMTVYRWLKKGILPGFKIGGRWRSKKDVLDAHLIKRIETKP